jgi:hypothetical protein
MSTGPDPAEPRHRGRSLLNTLIAVALLAEFVAIIGHPVFGWGDKHYAATPSPLTYNAPQPPSGAQVLLRLADRAKAQPAVSQGDRRYAYVKLESWSLNSGARSGRVVPALTQSWLAPDGSGRMTSVSVRAGRSITTSDPVTAGHPLAGLGDDAALAGLLAVGRTDDGDAPAWQLVAFAGLAARQPIPPAAESEILRRLARLPGLIDSGTTVDRRGRAGEAVSLTSQYAGPLIRYTLILAPGTGALEEFDQALLGSPQQRNVPSGAVLAFTTFLGSGWSARPGVAG